MMRLVAVDGKRCLTDDSSTFICLFIYKYPEYLLGETAQHYRYMFPVHCE